MTFFSAAPMTSETHSGADVGIFAKGPWAHLFHGVRNENYIGYVMAYSSCVGPFADRPNCDSAAGPIAAPTFISTLVALLVMALSK